MRRPVAQRTTLPLSCVPPFNPNDAQLNIAALPQGSWHRWHGYFSKRDFWHVVPESRFREEFVIAARDTRVNTKA